MTTNTTSKEAAVTIDTPEFQENITVAAWDLIEGGGSVESCFKEVFADIDAKLAKAEARAIAAEKALEAVRRGVECSAEMLECLGDIFSNTERPDKITVRIDDATNSLHVHYEDLDEEWLREVREALEGQEEDPCMPLVWSVPAHGGEPITLTEDDIKGMNPGDVVFDRESPYYKPIHTGSSTTDK